MKKITLFTIMLIGTSSALYSNLFTEYMTNRAATPQATVPSITKTTSTTLSATPLSRSKSKSPVPLVIKPNNANPSTKTTTKWSCSATDNYGNVVLGGTSNGHFAISWVNPSNPLSASILIFPAVIQSSTETCNGIIIDNNGNVVLAGTSTNQRGQNYFAAARATYDPINKGKADFTFGTKGMTHISIAIGGKINNQCNAITIDNSGNIILAGSSSNTTNQTFFSAARLTPQGILDTSFQNQGVVVIASLSTGYNDQCKSISVDTNNNAILTGISYDAAGSSYFAAVKIPATFTQ